MAESFDPYHKWLGISPKDQPPNHYRLLSIELFESDPDVIEGAADRQMAHVRTFQTGQNAALSQQLLNELSAARLCLLDYAKKTAYDAQLRQQRAVSAPSAQPPKGETLHVVVKESADSPAISIRTATTKRKSNNLPAAIVGAVAAIALFSTAAWWYIGSGAVGQQAVRQQSGSVANAKEETRDRSVAPPATNGSVAQSAGQASDVAHAPAKVEATANGAQGNALTNDRPRGSDTARQPSPERRSGPPRSAAAGKLDDSPRKAVKAPPAAKAMEDASAASELAASAATASSMNEAADGPSAPVKPELPRFHSTGNWLDALKVMDPLEHLVQGEWMRGRKDLQAATGGAAAMMEIPVEVEGSYDFQLQFTRTQGDGLLAVVFPAGVDRGQFWLNSADGEAGLSLAENAEPKESGAATPLVLSNNRRYALELRVRVLDQDAVHIEALLDKKELLVWDGLRSQLQVGQQPAVPPGLRFAVLSGPATTAAFHVIRIRSMSAEATPRSRTSLKSKGAVVKLRIAAKIDGRDRLQIDRTGARWIHETWDWPANVRFCGVDWLPQRQPGLPFDARLKNALAKVDFQSAQLSQISGRGEIRLQQTENGLEVVFDDDAAGFGADDYEAVVTLLRGN